jgi:hypothetical protein
VVDDEERLRQRIVLAVDALPVPPAPRRAPPRAASAIAFGGFSLAPLATVAVIAVVALLVVVPLVTGRGGPASPQTKLDTFSDDFSGGINTGRWTVMGAGTGHTVAAASGAVELTLEADAKPGSDGYMSASLWTQRCVARGDYDVSVDYELLDWPAANGTQFVLGEFPPGTATVRRDQQGDRDTYGASDQRNSASHGTTDTRGSLRLVRRGTSVAAAHRSSDSAPWIELPVQMTSQFDATFQIFLFAGGNNVFGGKKVRVAVDNFNLSAAKLICQ